MTDEIPGRTATWAKVLAVVLLIVFVPLIVWFLVTFRHASAIPW